MPKFEILTDISDAIIFRYNDVAGIGIFFSQNHAKQGCFAVAVTAHDPQSLSGTQGKADF
jgi:hypothetical protein